MTHRSWRVHGLSRKTHSTKQNSTKHQPHIELSQALFYFPTFYRVGYFSPYSPMAKVLVEMEFSDKLWKLQKMILLLRDHPEIRDSYELILSEWRNKYPFHIACNETILRNVRVIQCDLGMYPASHEVQEYRKRAHLRIVRQKSKQKNRATFLAKLWHYFSK